MLIAEDGANDLKNYPIKYINGKFWANNHVHVINFKENLGDNKFLKYCISKSNIESIIVGGSRSKLNSSAMLGLKLLIPKLNEQVKIGKLFNELDNLITLHQIEYKFIKTIKNLIKLIQI